MKFLAFLSYLFTIVQQPLGDALFVSKILTDATHYQGVRYCPDGRTSNLVFLIEESPAVADLMVGDQVHILSDGYTLVSRYEVFSVERYQAVTGWSAYSDFIAEDGAIFSSADLALNIFCGYGVLVIQTCYDGVAGRLFVMANKLPDAAFIAERN